MSREIKFRALTKKNNVMVFGDLIGCPNGEHRIIWFELKGELPLDVDYNDFNEVVQSGTISQFTGMLDKKGVEIYECDIISYPDKEIAEVYFCVEESQFRTIESGFNKDLYSRPLPNRSSKFIEVIGNIYQNPELLATI